RIAPMAQSGTACRDFIRWMGSYSPEFVAGAGELYLKTCEKCDDIVLLAATVDHHTAKGLPCPDALLTRLEKHLLAEKNATWDADVLASLAAADPTRSRPLLRKRAEPVWKGAERGSDLLPIKSLPPLLRGLIVADAEPDLEKKAEMLEKIADAKSLDEPERSWHGLGIARRLSQTYVALNQT